ncbi:MAG: ECF transporter S component [Ruminococcaceae bacterium]|nr:ECF transporter S component [Oscillospiraceae bacterium]
MKNRNQKILRMVGIALLMALVVVMQALSGMIPPVGGFSISLVLIPIVLGAAVYGPGAGALLGATFGAVVFINCVTGADPGGAMVFQASPVLCFLVVMAKGILCGLASGAIYKLFKTKNTYLAMMLAAIVCPLVNTGIFVICMYAFFMDILAAWAGGTNVLGYIMTGLLLANMVPELLINVIFSPAGARIAKFVAPKGN